MFKSGTVLVTPEKLNSTLVNQLPVVVYQQGKLINYGGPIHSLTDIAVKINGSYFMRMNCEFRVR
jgi:hypothetical protein